MNLLSLEQFKKLERKDPYYRNRWPYFRAVLDLLAQGEFGNVLELGPYKQPLVLDADVMDIRERVTNLAYLHDATVTPWPVPDDAYDLFIALQVWEHLRGRQREAFREVMRVSRNAILSFPLHWSCVGDMHHGISEALIGEWTLHVPPVNKIVADKRIIYVFAFDRSDPPEVRFEHTEELSHVTRHLLDLGLVVKRLRRRVTELEEAGRAAAGEIDALKACVDDARPTLSRLGRLEKVLRAPRRALRKSGGRRG